MQKGLKSSTRKRMYMYLLHTNLHVIINMNGHTNKCTNSPGILFCLWRSRDFAKKTFNKKRKRVLILTQSKLWDLQTNSRSGTMGTRPTEWSIWGADLPIACSVPGCEVSVHNNAVFAIAMRSGISQGLLSQPHSHSLPHSIGWL